MAKMGKRDRRNQFLMVEASKKAEKIAALLVTELGEVEALNTPAYDEYAAEVAKRVKILCMKAYAQGVNDALDAEDGRSDRP